MLRVLTCRRQYDDSYVLNRFEGTLDDMDRVAAEWAAHYERMQS